MSDTEDFSPVKSPLKNDKKYLEEREKQKQVAKEQKMKNFINALKVPPKKRSPIDDQLIYDFMKRNQFIRKLFNDYSEETIQYLCHHLNFQQSKVDDPIFFQGDLAKDFFLIISGEVGIYMNVYKRDQNVQKNIPQQKIRQQEQQLQRVILEHEVEYKGDDLSDSENEVFQKNISNSRSPKNNLSFSDLSNYDKDEVPEIDFIPLTQRRSKSTQRQSCLLNQNSQIRKSVNFDSFLSTVDPLKLKDSKILPRRYQSTQLAKSFNLKNQLFKRKLKLIKTLQEGESFGELSLVQAGAATRSATVISLSDCKFATLSAPLFRNLLRSKKLEDAEKHVKHLGQLPLFADIKNQILHKFFNYCQILQYSKGQYVYKQKEDAEYFYIIIKGEFQKSQSLDILKKEESTYYKIQKNMKEYKGKSQKKQEFSIIGENQYFGHLEIIKQQTRQEDVQCISQEAEVYQISQIDLQRMFQEEETILKRLQFQMNQTQGLFNGFKEKSILIHKQNKQLFMQTNFKRKSKVGIDQDQQSKYSNQSNVHNYSTLSKFNTTINNKNKINMTYHNHSNSNSNILQLTQNKDNTKFLQHNKSQSQQFKEPGQLNATQTGSFNFNSNNILCNEIQNQEQDASKYKVQKQSSLQFFTKSQSPVKRIYKQQNQQEQTYSEQILNSKATNQQENSQIQKEQVQQQQQNSQILEKSSPFIKNKSFLENIKIKNQENSNLQNIVKNQIQNKMNNMYLNQVKQQQLIEQSKLFTETNTKHDKNIQQKQMKLLKQVADFKLEQPNYRTIPAYRTVISPNFQQNGYIEQFLKNNENPQLQGSLTTRQDSSSKINTIINNNYTPLTQRHQKLQSQQFSDLQNKKQISNTIHNSGKNSTNSMRDLHSPSKTNNNSIHKLPNNYNQDQYQIKKITSLNNLPGVNNSENFKSNYMFASPKTAKSLQNKNSISKSKFTIGSSQQFLTPRQSMGDIEQEIESKNNKSNKLIQLAQYKQQQQQLQNTNNIFFSNKLYKEKQALEAENRVVYQSNYQRLQQKSQLAMMDQTQQQKLFKQHKTSLGLKEKLESFSKADEILQNKKQQKIKKKDVYQNFYDGVQRQTKRDKQNIQFEKDIDKEEFNYLNNSPTKHTQSSTYEAHKRKLNDLYKKMNIKN